MNEKSFSETWTLLKLLFSILYLCKYALRIKKGVKMNEENLKFMRLQMINSSEIQYNFIIHFSLTM